MSKREKWLYPLLLLVLGLVHLILFFRFRNRISKRGRFRIFGWLVEVLKDFGAGVRESNCWERLTRYLEFLWPKLKREKRDSPRLNLKKLLRRLVRIIKRPFVFIEWEDD